MLTRIEIDGFKTFEKFSIDLRPFSAIVGPNATGKSNLFDAIRLVSKLSSSDVGTAITELRGEPHELFRSTSAGISKRIRIRVEVLLPDEGEDQFGSKYSLQMQRLSYEIELAMGLDRNNKLDKVYVIREACDRIKKSEDRAGFLKGKRIRYGGNLKPLLTTIEEGDRTAFRIRQDGPGKSGKPQLIPATEATRTALSTITTAEFPHLYALRDFLANPSFLEINPREARRENDRFKAKDLLPDASNLAAVISRIKDDTASDAQPEGALVDISRDLSRLIPSTMWVHSVTSSDQKEYSYEVQMADGLTFSSRVISDGTLRLLALITSLHDPKRRGLLCFEEPENGIHQGRVETLVEIMRDATGEPENDYFQILVNTHSPVVMASLRDEEIVAADIVVSVIGEHLTRRTRMRGGASPIGDLISPDTTLTRYEIERLLQYGPDIV